MISTDNPRPRRRMLGFTANLVAGIWVMSTMALAAYAVLKPRTTASDLLAWFPRLSNWLDANYDLRTFIMTVGILIVPVVIFGSPHSDRMRRCLVALIVATLLGLEIAQLWIPTRGFGVADLAYTLAGGVVIEMVVLVSRRFASNR